MKKLQPPQPLLIEEFDLEGIYSVIEVATLASVCGGETPDEKIDCAIRLLAAAEKRAKKSAAQKLHLGIQSDMRINGQSDLAESAYPQDLAHSLMVAKSDESRWRKILERVQKDEPSGKIDRASLIREICDAAGVIWTAQYARRKFLEWLEEMWSEAKKHVAPISPGQSLSFEVYQSLLQGGHKTILIHDAETALWIISNFYEWIGLRRDTHARKK